MLVILKRFREQLTPLSSLYMALPCSNVKALCKLMTVKNNYIIFEGVNTIYYCEVHTT